MLQSKTTVALVDGHPIVMEGLAKLLAKKKDLTIVGKFTTGLDFLTFFRHTKVGIVLLDIMLPDMNGMDLCKEIKTMAPETTVLALSNHHNRSVIMKMLQNGASGYMLKNIPVEELMDCINEALNGQITFSQVVKEIIASPQVIDHRELVKLTTREKEILLMIASGKTTGDIAEQLHLSKFTIESHRKNLLQKFKAKNVATLISAASQQGFL